jgi:hypothetical protein
VVGIRAVFLIPETNGYSLITFCGDEADRFVKSLLFAEQRNDVPIKNIGKLGGAIIEGLALSFKLTLRVYISTSWLDRLEG